MCGIVGILNLKSDNTIDAIQLKRMADTIRHRGPDDDGVWIGEDGRVGLAHRRLSIVDLSSAGRQPMANEDGSVLVTFNGEIYNFAELRMSLEKRGHKFRSQSDTEVLVHLYEEHGEDLVDYLDGDFAFGIWDTLGRCLMLARDRAGVKPLYYTLAGGRLLFASEIKALLSHPDVPREMDHEALYHYLTYLVVPSPKTLCRGIFKLPAAGRLVIRQEPGAQPEITNYWEPLPGRVDVDEKDLDEQLSELFDRAVRKRLMSDVPVGVLFSGGVDSTLNAASFSQLISPEKVRTFNVGMPGNRHYAEESDFARRMARELGTRHYEVAVTEEDLLRSARELASCQDEPISDPVVVPLYFVTKLARETGTIVLHAGEGADEIFCGYDNYRRFLRHYGIFWKPLSHLPRAVSGAGHRLLRHSPKPRHLKMADALLRLNRGQEFFMSSAVAYYEDEKRSILSRDFKHRHKDLDSFDVVAPFYERIDKIYPEASLLQKITYIELKLRLPELLLMRADKMSMANSVEMRVPFLDRDLVDFALSVPDSYKLRNGISKEPIKRLASRYVDRNDIYRPKAGFGAPIQDWFAAKLGTEFAAMLEEDRQDLEAIFDVKALKHNLTHGLQTVNQAFQLWVIYNMVVWWRTIIRP